MQMRTAANESGSQTSGLWSLQVHVTPASLNRRHERVMLQERVSLESQPSHMKKGVLKNSAQNGMQVRKNSRNLCHLPPIILLITSHCERLPLSTGSLIICCICPHFPQCNQQLLPAAAAAILGQQGAGHSESVPSRSVWGFYCSRESQIFPSGLSSCTM